MKEINNELQEYAPALKRSLRAQTYFEHIDDICSILNKFLKLVMERKI